jgi:hypothetical protein
LDGNQGEGREGIMHYNTEKYTTQHNTTQHNHNETQHNTAQNPAHHNAIERHTHARPRWSGFIVSSTDLKDWEEASPELKRSKIDFYLRYDQRAPKKENKAMHPPGTSLKQ